MNANSQQTLFSRDRTLAPSEQEAGWYPELFWTFLKREKSSVFAGIRIRLHPEF
jgi:hypothetical protein